MKLRAIATVIALATSIAPQAMAQEWDLPPLAPQVAVIEPNSAPLMTPPPQFTLTTPQEILQWDMAELAARRGGNTTEPTGQDYYVPSSNQTRTQAALNLPPCTTAVFAYIGGNERHERERERRRERSSGKGENASGLPSTSLDSFVQTAGGQAESIYGDEGTVDIPPLFHFDTINSGIHGQSAAGLTTGHESNLPSAWY